MQPAPLNDFASYPQPSWNTAGSIDAAIDKVIMAASQNEATKAHEAVLDALGNNHAGTYYPVALAVVPHLGFQVEWGGPWAQHAAVQALLDLTGSFEPERGHEVLGLPGAQQQVHLRKELRAQVRLLLPVLRSLAEHGQPASKGAQELIELVDGEA